MKNHPQPVHLRMSRRELLKLGAFGAAWLAGGTLVSACGGAAPQPTVTLAPTLTPTPKPSETPSIGSILTEIPNFHTIKTRDGRTLAYMEGGKLDGIPVVVHQSTPTSRLLFRDWLADASSKGIRLIGYDRPGYGDSTLQPGRSVAGASQDLADLAQALGLKKLMTWGLSGGGPHVIACAALLPELVVAAASLASPAPYLPFTAEGKNWFSLMDSGNYLEFQAALQGRDALDAQISASYSYLNSIDSESYYNAALSTLWQSETAAFTREVSDDLLASAQLGVKNGLDGVWEDDIAFVTEWGAEPGQIKVPFLLLHGELDILVPVAHGKWLAEKIPGVEARFFPKNSHLGMLSHIPEVHEWLLSKWK